jgi:hypothetical protein
MSLLTARLCYQFERSLKVHLKVVKETGATPSIRDIQTLMGLPQTIWCVATSTSWQKPGIYPKKLDESH